MNKLLSKIQWVELAWSMAQMKSAGSKICSLIINGSDYLIYVVGSPRLGLTNPFDPSSYRPHVQISIGFQFLAPKFSCTHNTKNYNIIIISNLLY